MSSFCVFFIFSTKYCSKKRINQDFKQSLTITWENGTYIAGSDITVNDQQYDHPVEVSGNVKLILADGVTLNVPKGIHVNQGATLSVYAQEKGTGRLIATGGYEVTGSNYIATAGIGARYTRSYIYENSQYEYENYGTINVYGGNIEAHGTSDFPTAGIGGSASQSSGIITINGGTVTANGSYSSSDIGCGSASFYNVTDNDMVIINDGNITANGMASSFGIGSCNGSDVSIPVSLRWKDQNTRIYAKYYNAVVSLDREYLFKFDGDATAVTADNIDGKTLIPDKYVDIPEYTVNFYKNLTLGESDEIYASQTVYEGDHAQIPDEIWDDTLTFTEWTDKDGDPFDFSTAITQNTDLYANWKYRINNTDYYLVKVIADEGSTFNITIPGGLDSYEGYEEGSSSDYYEETTPVPVEETTPAPEEDSSENENESENNGYVCVSDDEWCAWLPEGKTITLSVTPAAGKTVTGVFANGMPLEESDGEYALTVPEKNITVTAEYGTRKYTVTWKNGDTVLETDENLTYGTAPEYNGETPEKAADAQYTYTFSGWSPEVSAVTDDVTYTAQFSETLRTYTVKWVNYDGQELRADTVEYGTIPSYDSETPVKPSTAQYDYTFTGWNNKPAAVTGNVTYSAQFDETIRSYTVTWKDTDGTVIKTDENVEYGTMPEFDGTVPTAPEGYHFTGWSPEISEVTGDTEYTAVFAAYSENPHIVSVFIEGYETPFRVQTVADGNTFADNSFHSMSVSQKDKYWEFLGWYTENDEKYDFSQPVTTRKKQTLIYIFFI